MMIAAERSGHDAGANRDAESVEPWETGDDATAQGGEEISDREVAAFAGHSPKNASHEIDNPVNAGIVPDNF